MTYCCAPGRGDEPAAATPLPGCAGTGADAVATMVTLGGGSFRMGSVNARAYAADGEGPIHVVELGAFHIDAVTREQRPLRLVRRRHGPRNRGGAVRLVVCLRRVPARRLPEHPRRGRRPLVAASVRSRLAPPRRPRVRSRRTPRPPGSPRLVERRPGVLRVERDTAADGSRMGVRGARRAARHGVSRGATTSNPRAAT